MMFYRKLFLFCIAFKLLIKGVACSCNTHQSVERGDNMTISCRLAVSTGEHYWYQGSTSDSHPILRLKNGNKGGTKYNDGHYDITDEGFMKIINAQIEHEAVYTFVVIFSNRSTWSQPISVGITVTPEPPCPTIQFCTGCDECSKNVSSSTNITLSCSIMEIRPKVELYWLDESDKTLFNQSLSEVMSPLTHTWTISSSITFKLESCGEQMIVYCSVQNNAEMTFMLNRTLVLHSEKCSEWFETSPENSPLIWIIIVGGFSFLFFGLSLIIFTNLKRHHFKTQDSLESVLKQLYLIDQSLGNLEHFYNNGRIYKAMFPSDDQPAVPNELDETSLLKHLETLGSNHRVLFLGEAGIGKTCFFRHILRRWSEGKILRGHILIYFQLWQITEMNSLEEEIQQLLPPSAEISIDDIQQTLQSRSTIIMLDGVSNLNISKTLGKLKPLQTETNETSPINIWATCRNVDENINTMYKSSMNINLNEFNDQDIYINLERFVKSLKLHLRNELSERLNENKIWIGDGETEEAHEASSLVQKDSLERTILRKVKEHIHTLINPLEKATFTYSVMSRLFILIYLCSNSEEEMDNKAKLVFRFSSEKSQVINQFIKDGQWEIVACLLDAGTEENKFEYYAKMLQFKNIVFPYTIVDSHQQSVLRLLHVLTVSDTALSSLDICVNNPLNIVNYLPSVRGRLTLRYASLPSKDFEAFIKEILLRPKYERFQQSVQFCDCNIPDKPKKILDFSAEDKLEVLRTKGNKTVYLNFKKGKWKSMQSDKEECQHNDLEQLTTTTFEFE